MKCKFMNGNLEIDPENCKNNCGSLFLRIKMKTMDNITISQIECCGKCKNTQTKQCHKCIKDCEWYATITPNGLKQTNDRQNNFAKL